MKQILSDSIALDSAGYSGNIYIYSNARHGFGYRPDAKTAAGAWPVRLREWIVDCQLIDVP